VFSAASAFCALLFYAPSALSFFQRFSFKAICENPRESTAQGPSAFSSASSLRFDFGSSSACRDCLPSFSPGDFV